MSSDPADDFAQVVPEVDAPVGFLTQSGKRTYDVLVGSLLAVCGVAVLVLPTALQFRQQQQIADGQQFLQVSCGAEWQGQYWTVSPDWVDENSRLDRRDLTDNAPVTEVAQIDFSPRALLPDGATLWLVGDDHVARMSPDHLEPIKFTTRSMANNEFHRAGNRLFATEVQLASQAIAQTPTSMDVATGQTSVTALPNVSEHSETRWVTVIHEWVNGEWSALGELDISSSGPHPVSDEFPIYCKVFEVDGGLVTWMIVEGTPYWAEGLPLQPLGTAAARAAAAQDSPVSALVPANAAPVQESPPHTDSSLVWHRTDGPQATVVDQVLRLGDRWMLLDSTMPFAFPGDYEASDAERIGSLAGVNSGELRLYDLQDATWHLQHTLPVSSLGVSQHEFSPTDQPDQWLVNADSGLMGRKLVRVRADGFSPAFTMASGMSRLVWLYLDSMINGTAIGVSAQFLMVFGTAWLMRMYRYPYVAVSREEVRLAGLVSRSVARLIDVIVFSVPIYAATGLYLWLNYEELLTMFRAGAAITPDKIVEFVIQFLVVLAIWFGYWLLAFLVYAMVLAWTGATPGKWLMGIRVCQNSLAQPGLGRAFVRELVYIVDSFASMLVGIATIAYTQKFQRVGDLLAGTMVVSARSLGAARARLQERSH